MQPFKNYLGITRRTLLAVAAIAIAAPTASAAEFTAKIGHLESDKQSRHIFLEKVAELVKERTKGAVEFEIYPSAQLGNQRQMTEGVQLGTIEATVSPAAFIGGFNPAVSILDIPFLLPADPDKAQQLRDGEFGKALLATFESKGVVAIQLWPNGLKNFTSNKALDDLNSFEGQKFRTMDSKILIEQFAALGASAIALPFGELYTSLQTGVVDGEENPLDTIQRMKFNEVQKYLVVSNHGAMEDVVMFNPTWWNSLPDDYKKVIQDAFAEVVPDLRAHKEQAVNAALEEIKKGGMNVRVATDDEKAALREKTYDKTKAAYLGLAGSDGEKLIGIYEKAYSELK